MPGLARVVRSDRLNTAHDDSLTRALALGYVAGRSGDLFVIPKRDWIVEQRSDNDATTHGTMYDYDRRVPLILLGRAVKPGRFTESASPADIAPTLAHLAGISLPKAEGRRLSEATR
jgi:arylsulfatase A-like enzyme